MDFTAAFGRNGLPPGKPPSGIDAFDDAEPAPEFELVPGGIYSARVVRGEVARTKTKDEECYRLKFEIVDGPCKGKTLIRVWTFSAAALPYTRRDLAAFGLTSSAALLSPFPSAGKEYLVRLVVARQCGNDGIERNDVKKIDVLRVTESPAAPHIVGDGQGEGGPQR